MTKPIIAIAEEGERKLVRQYLSQLLQTDESNIVVTGVGAINIFHSLSSLPKDSTVVNIGYAGSANFEIGSVVAVTEARLNHPNVTYPEPQLLLHTDIVEQALAENNAMEDQTLIKATGYTNCDFVLQSDYKDCVFDMELAFIAAIGFMNVQSLKIVSDNLSLHTYRKYGSGVEEN